VNSGNPLDLLSLLLVTSVLAPILEESLFRGFLLTSLTRYMPNSGAVVISSLVFALAHFTPKDAPQLFALGLVLVSNQLMNSFFLKNIRIVFTYPKSPEGRTLYSPLFVVQN
jgi:hypothetical protein